MDLSPTGGRYGVGGITRYRDLCILPSEHSRAVHYDQAHYGSVSGGGEAYEVTGGQAMVVEGRLILGMDADGCLGGGTGVWGGGDGQGGDGDGWLIMQEDTAENLILGTEPNTPLDYAPVLELHHPIISMTGRNGGRLEIERVDPWTNI